jgi:tetratricopeptide (TPR) repeat protein
MKKKYVYACLLLVVLASAAITITWRIRENDKKETVYSDFLPRKQALAYTAEYAVVKNNGTLLLKKVKQNPDDIKSLLHLTALYIQEARNTGNYNYYNEAALKSVNAVLKKDTASFEALTFKATILLSQHRFSEGLAIASRAQELYPLNAYVYGLIIDGNVELGNYRAALDAAEKMISIRPDIRSYSRIAYLREIHGDIPGAIEAMDLAVDAGAPGDENTEWCRIQLGKLHEQMGQMTTAGEYYTVAADNRPNYPYALAGLARVAIDGKNYAQALALYQQADSLMSDHTFKEGIAKVHQLQGAAKKAKEVSAEILRYMQQFSSDGKKGPATGQNEDHEMAHAYIGVGDYDKALAFALAEYNRRPANIEVNETVAIVYYHKGDYAKAVPYMDAALKTNCRNPELLCYAGLIYAKAGQPARAKMCLQQALAKNPFLPAELEKESRAALAGLL